MIKIPKMTVFSPEPILKVFPEVSQKTIDLLKMSFELGHFTKSISVQKNNSNKIFVTVELHSFEKNVDFSLFFIY